MLPTQHGKLVNELRQGLRLNKARADCFAAAAIAAVQTQSVRLADIVVHLPCACARTRKPRRRTVAHVTGDWLDMGMCHVCGVYMGVCGVRTSKDELLILRYSGVSASDAKLFYLRRWNIETGFEKLKTHGFHLESSRLRGGGKYERLMAVLAVGFVWCYAMGAWSVSNGKPIRVIRRLGRCAQSVFRRDRELLVGMLLGTCAYVGKVRPTAVPKQLEQ